MVEPSNIGMKFRGVKSDQILWEKTEPKPINQATPPAIKVMRLREAPGLSTSRETTDSSIEIEVLSAANNTNNKNKVPIICPPGI